MGGVDIYVRILIFFVSHVKYELSMT